MQRILAIPVVLCMLVASAGARGATLDLTSATVVTAAARGTVEINACRLLVEEAAKRTGLTMATSSTPPTTGPVIYLGTILNPPAGMPSMPKLTKARAEGYRLKVYQSGGRPVVVALGNDIRGCVFVAGRLLREMYMSAGHQEAPPLNISEAPAKSLRGHQIGFRSTSNTYDQWDPAQFEQYVRDMVVFGANAVELIPFADANADAEIAMNAQFAQIAASYGMQVWLWFPLNDPGCDLATMTGYQALIDNRRKVFSTIPNIDAVFIPGGDPAGTASGWNWVDMVMKVSADIATVLHQYHPKAQVWLSNQGFSASDNALFQNYLNAKPAWLDGVVYGPWTCETMQHMRDTTPARYPLRQYPDITHTCRAQYPAEDWDVAYALTLGREPPMYQPVHEAQIAKMYQSVSCGAITYSEGVNDDFNKCICSAVLWNPTVDADTVAHWYARYFFGPEYETAAVQGLMGLENDWQGPLLTNSSVSQTFTAWNNTETIAPTTLMNNWRFQMALLRAYYDLYIQERLQADTSAQRSILGYLASYTVSPANAVATAIANIDNEDAMAIDPATRQQIFDLSAALYSSIGIQLSVPLYGASGEERGAILDYVDSCITNLGWMRGQLVNLQSLSDPTAIAAGISAIVNYENPGTGGYYDALGVPSARPHLIRTETWAQDPGYMLGTRTDFALTNPWDTPRASVISYAETLYGTPIVMQYTGLNTSAQYAVRMTYSGRYHPVMRLTANETYAVTGPVNSPNDSNVQYLIPQAATSTGTLTLRWDLGSGRGCEVSEVWLMRK